ncbi:MAG: HPF/RaiA family ribosome-associated protein [Kiritimatiellae bacterium]|nr:HPF/RaiA family ribosome-associated protein [Kiritimatiellia bacterium]
MSIGWNLVCRNLTSTKEIREKIRHKIGKMERHLKGFLPDSLFLHVAIEKQTSHKPGVKTVLVLRLPAHVLKTEKSGADAMQSVDNAVKALLQEIESVKAHIRKDHTKRRDRRQDEDQSRTVLFAAIPEPEGIGPQNPKDVISDLLNEQYDRLVKYVYRQIEHVAQTRGLAAGRLNARTVVDQAAARALAAPEQLPGGMSYQVWLYALAREEFERGCTELAQEAGHTLSMDEAASRQPHAEESDETPIDYLSEQMQPDPDQAALQASDEESLSPDEELERKELIANVRRIAEKWPKQERDVFDLYFIEGFSPREIALIQNRRPHDVREAVSEIRQRLRDLLQNHPARLEQLEDLADQSQAHDQRPVPVE